MPELPEVQTIVSDLNKILPGLKIVGAWSDWQKMFWQPKNFAAFKKEILASKILSVKRRAKYILTNLEGNKTIIIHQKLTGHLLYGKWEFKNGAWQSKIPGPLASDPQNRFLHLVLELSNGYQLALSDLRKFAKVLVWETDKLGEFADLKKLGPEPLQKDFTLTPMHRCGGFTFSKFQEILKNKKGKIKQVLMNQEVIAGIGNIYSDEILWEAGVHPLKEIRKLNEKEFKKIYAAIPKVLNLAIKFGGDSMSDYRRPSGERGEYQNIQNAYQMDGTKCKKNDGGIIKRIKIGGRSAHFCPKHQKL